MSAGWQAGRGRGLLVAAALVVALGPLGASANTSLVPPDDATAAAIQKWRSTAVALVDAASQDEVARSYTDDTVAATNATIIKRDAAEQAALSRLDVAAAQLVRAYLAATRPGGPDGPDN